MDRVTTQQAFLSFLKRDRDLFSIYYKKTTVLEIYQYLKTTKILWLPNAAYYLSLVVAYEYQETKWPHFLCQVQSKRKG